MNGAAARGGDGRLSPLGRSALAYARRWRLLVLPLSPRNKEPHGLLVPRGFLDATLDEATIASWWTRVPDANVGVACAPSGLVVVDVDPRNGGDDTLIEVEREFGPLPPTWTVLTPGGGAHFYFQFARGDAVGGLGDGLDVKYRGYVVAPPSTHPNGGLYRWDSGAHPLDTAIADLPEPWMARIRGERAPAPLASSGMDARESFLGVAFESLGWLGAALSDGRRHARCPWASAHSDGRGDGGDSSTVLFPRAVGATLGGFVCSHGHCSARTLDDVLRALPPEAIDAGAKAFPAAYRSIIRRLAAAARRAP